MRRSTRVDIDSLSSLNPFYRYKRFVKMLIKALLGVGEGDAEQLVSDGVEDAECATDADEGLGVRLRRECLSERRRLNIISSSFIH